MYRLTEPAWCFNYNASNGIANDVSRLTPYAIALSMNPLTYKNEYPAFIQNAVAGVRGQGILHYGVLASTQYVSNIAQHKNTTHVWSMAIPSSMNAPIGIFTANFNAGVYYAPNYNIVGPSINANYVWYVDTDHYLKFGCTLYNGYNAPPDFSINFGVDMTPYMYAPTVNNTDAYCGHRYAMVYDADNRAYNLFVDNTDTLLAAVTENNVAQITLSIMNTATYNDWFNINGGAINNYSLIGPGAYMGSTSLLNAYNQGVVYISDWYGWETVLNKEELQSVFEYNWKAIMAPKATSTLAPFSRCDNLEAITIPPVENIGKNTVQYCNNLKNIVISNGTNEISSQAFYYCPLASSVRIPVSVNNIQLSAFYDCPNFKDVTISANCPVIEIVSPSANVCNFKFYQEPLRLSARKYVKKGLLNNSSKLVELPGYTVDRSVSPITVSKLNETDLYTGGEMKFNGSVNDRALSQYSILSSVVKEETETTITFEGRSIREPNITTTYTVDKLDTYGFNIAATRNTAKVAILGHVNNSFSTVPTLLDNSWIVTRINNVASNDAVIDCLPYIATDMADGGLDGVYGIPNISNSFNDVSNVTIKNAEYVVISKSFCNCAEPIIFENCNYIYADTLSFKDGCKPQFINCNIVAIPSTPNDADEFDLLLNQNYVMFAHNLGIGNVSPELVLKNVHSDWVAPNYIEKESLLSVPMPRNLVYGATLHNITMIDTPKGNGALFVNCSGDFNLNIQTNNLNCQGVISSHNGTGNVTIAANHIPVSKEVISSTNLNSIFLSVDSIVEDCNSNDGAMFQALTVNTVDIVGENIPCGFMHAATISGSFNSDATRIGAYAFKNCNLAAISGLPSLINNCTYIGTNAFQDAILPATDITVTGNIAQNAFNAVRNVRNLNIRTTRSEYSTDTEPVHCDYQNMININCISGSEEISVSAYNADTVYIGGYRKVGVWGYNKYLRNLTIDDACSNLSLIIGMNNLTHFNLPKYCLKVSGLEGLTGISDIWVNPKANLYNLPSTVTVHYYTDLFTSYEAYASGPVTVGDTVDSAIVEANGIYANGAKEQVFAAILSNHYMPALPVGIGAENCIKVIPYNTAAVYNYEKYGATYEPTGIFNGYHAQAGTNGVIFIKPANYTAANINAIHQETTVPITMLIINGWMGARLRWSPNSLNNVTEACIMSQGASVSGLLGKFTNHINLRYLSTSQNMLNAGNAYMNCRNLITADLSGVCNQYLAGTNTFKDCINLSAILVSNNVRVNTIGTNAFCGCINLTSIDLSPLCNAKINIMANAFRNCTKLNNVVFPKNLKNVATYAFYNTALKSVSIPTGCVVGTSAFPSDCVITYI